MSLALGMSYVGGGMGLSPLQGESAFGAFGDDSDGGFNWKQVALTGGLNLGETFIKAKYAKDASKYTGGYFPQGQQQQGSGRYETLSTTGANAANSNNTTVTKTAGHTAESIANFIQDNLGVLAIAGVFALAWMRKPK